MLSFRKLVAYLAYTPAALWNLAKQVNPIKKNIIKNNIVIWLSSLSILVVCFAFFLSPKAIPPKPVVAAIANPTLSLKVSPKNPIISSLSPGQLLELDLQVINNSQYDVQESLIIDLSGLIDFVTVLPNHNIVVNNTTAIWNLPTLAPQQVLTTTMSFQALNSFTVNYNLGQTARFSFGNNLELPIKLSSYQRIIFWLQQESKNLTIFITTIAVLITIIIAKIYNQLECYTMLVEIKILRDHINQGGTVV